MSSLPVSQFWSMAACSHMSGSPPVQRHSLRPMPSTTVTTTFFLARVTSHGTWLESPLNGRWMERRPSLSFGNFNAIPGMTLGGAYQAICLRTPPSGPAFAEWLSKASAARPKSHGCNQRTFVTARRLCVKSNSVKNSSERASSTFGSAVCKTQLLRLNLPDTPDSDGNSYSLTYKQPI